MLQSLFGSSSRESILTLLVNNQEGYATQIAHAGGVDLYAIQTQLKKFEAEGILQSRVVGRTRVYSFNPEYPLVGELKGLIEKAVLNRTGLGPKQGSVPLPGLLRGFFWDYSFENLSWEKDRELIVRRLLTEGSWEAIQWLRKQMGDDGLRKWMIAHHGRGLSPRQIRFWSLLLSIPKFQSEAWLSAARGTPWSQR